MCLELENQIARVGWKSKKPHIGHPEEWCASVESPDSLKQMRSYLDTPRGPDVWQRMGRLLESKRRKDPPAADLELLMTLPANLQGFWILLHGPY